MYINTKYVAKLEHLTTEQIENLKSEYYAGENVNRIIEKYKVDIRASNLWKSFPLVEAKDESCKFCGSIMYFISPSKTSKNKKEYLCTACLHRKSFYGCNCNQCLREKAAEKEQAKIEKSLRSKKNRETYLRVREYTNAPLLSMLTIKERAYLGAILRTSLHHDNLLIDLDCTSSHYYAPTTKYRDMIASALLKRNIIVSYRLHDDEDKKILNRYIRGSLYDICITDANMSKREIVTYLMYPSEVGENQKDDALEVMREVNVYEAIEYMMILVQRFNLNGFEVDEKYMILFSEILKRYSLGQLFNFIYASVRNQAARTNQRQQGYVPLANYIYKLISDRYDKARVENWKIVNYNRSWEGQQTELSKLVSSRLLGIGESAFYQVV